VPFVEFAAREMRLFTFNMPLAPHGDQITAVDGTWSSLVYTLPSNQPGPAMVDLVVVCCVLALSWMRVGRSSRYLLFVLRFGRNNRLKGMCRSHQGRDERSHGTQRRQRRIGNRRDSVDLSVAGKLWIYRTGRLEDQYR
jgi:hypothetical protein